LPEVPDTRLSRDPDESVNTLAETPTPEELMAAARPARVLFEDGTSIVCAFPSGPTWSVIEPDSVSEAFVIGVRYPLDVVARLVTTTVWFPATEEEEAARSCSAFVSELEPVFCAMMPVRFVNELTSLESFENRVPRLEITVSWLCKDVNCDFQGVSTLRRLPTIVATVALTSKPVPPVGDPKLRPTVPIVYTP